MFYILRFLKNLLSKQNNCCVHIILCCFEVKIKEVRTREKKTDSNRQVIIEILILIGYWVFTYVVV